jgi:hypothetical protein
MSTKQGMSKTIIQAEYYNVDMTRTEAEIILKYLKNNSNNDVDKKDLELLVNVISRLQACLRLI